VDTLHEAFKRNRVARAKGERNGQFDELRQNTGDGRHCWLG
jgi:hypothetical protein